ncbi:MAG: hypothetical protein WAN32_19585, partial [Candidatus Acidiferrum sp.]
METVFGAQERKVVMAKMGATETSELADRTATSNQEVSGAPLCRFCNTPVRQTFVDLGMSPLCESYLSAEQLNQMEPFYPLYVRVCGKCFLVQLEEYVSPENIFSDYAYFSSYS